MKKKKKLLLLLGQKLTFSPREKGEKEKGEESCYSSTEPQTPATQAEITSPLQEKLLLLLLKDKVIQSCG